MTAKTHSRIVILFEDEVRVAAIALERMRMALDSESATEDDKDKACSSALRACMVALANADDEGATLLLGRKSDLVKLATR